MRILEHGIIDKFAAYGVIKSVSFFAWESRALDTFTTREGAEMAFQALSKFLFIYDQRLKLAWATPLEVGGSSTTENNDASSNIPIICQYCRAVIVIYLFIFCVFPIAHFIQFWLLLLYADRSCSWEWIWYQPDASQTFNAQALSVSILACESEHQCSVSYSDLYCFGRVLDRRWETWLGKVVGQLVIEDCDQNVLQCQCLQLLWV